MAFDLSEHFPLKPYRVHEVCGPSAVAFTSALAGMRRGGVFWARENWQGDQLNPVALQQYFDPHSLILAKGKDQTDVLATAEEALRSGAFTLAVLELTKPIGLTAGRRLQLAAKAGKTTGLCIVPDGEGSNAAETRWHCAPLFDQVSTPTDSTLQRWKLIKNKSGTLTAWDVRWNAETRRIIVVSQTGERPVSPRAPD